MFDKTTYDKMIKEVPTYKLITQSVLVDRMRINGSLARAAIKHLEAEGYIRLISRHGSQLIYTRSTKVCRVCVKLIVYRWMMTKRINEEWNEIQMIPMVFCVLLFLLNLLYFIPSFYLIHGGKLQSEKP